MEPADLRASLAHALAGDEDTQLGAETLNLACFWISREADRLDFSVAEAPPALKILLRAAGRLIIDAGGPGAAPEAWPNTEDMLLRWLDEIARRSGYRLTPLAGGGREELRDQTQDW